jgi:hypothetical protein
MRADRGSQRHSVDTGTAPGDGADPELAAAYRRTAYRVHDLPPFILRIGDPSPALLQTHAARGVNWSAFVTACNPQGQLRSSDENGRLHAAFLRRLREGGHRFVPGTGGDAHQAWPPEPSALIFGLTLAQSSDLGRTLAQRAFLWNGPDGVPRLIWLA